MYKLLLCIRYLRTRYIALASIISVMLGVATMIVVNSVMAGFTTEMRDRIHGYLADVLIESRNADGIPDSADLLKRVDDAVGEHVEAATCTVEMPGVVSMDIRGETYTTPVTIIGIVPSEKARVGPLLDCLASYNPGTEHGSARPALRSRDVPVGWELTGDAAERRRAIMQQRESLLRNQGLLETSGLTEPGPQHSIVADATESETLQEPDFDEPATTDSQAASPFDDQNPFEDFEDVAFDDVASGIRKEPQDARIYIGEELVSYQVRNPETGNLEKVMMLQPGEDVTLTTVTRGRPPKPVSFEATICDVFRSGMSEYDSQLVLMNLEELQKNRGMLTLDENGNIAGDAVTSIQIKLKDYADSETVVRRLKAVFPPGMVTVRTWESKQGLLLSAVEMETAILNVLLFLIITVAGFGILAIFFMIVVEKTRDIGILKSLGASSQGVMSIFLSYGLGLGLVGSLAGVTMGLVFVHHINQIEAGLSWLTGRRVFDRDIYYFSSIPTQVSPMMVFWVAVGAIGIAVLASVLPARRASRLHPVRALRFD
ncbi:MAG: FtsX-like permease family protein [Fuerstiella sp.]|nr:FtsX-like permease family protein [Fuerstiella sp.]